MSKRFKIIIAFLSFLGLFGCTELTKPATGSVHVEISGLPANKTVVLSSPGYSKTLRGSSTVYGLKPDRYIINAPVFTINSVKYRAKVSKSPISVVAGQTAFVSVKYSSEQMFKLTVAYEGLGKISTYDGKIDCGLNMNRCSYDYKKDSKVYLIATPGYQHKFLHWDKEEENSNRIIVTMDKEQSKKAFFAKTSKADISDPMPASFNLVAKTSEKRSASFSFSNEGSEDLNYKVSSEENWLSFSKVEGSVKAEKDETIAFDASCPKEVGKLEGKILIESNDPDESKKFVSVALSCEAAPKEYELKVVVSGKGEVSSKDGKIVCSEEKTEKCSFKYPESTEIVLETKGLEEEVFLDWSGDIVSKDKELKLVISKDLELAAKFGKEAKPAKISEIRPSKVNLEARINSANAKTIYFKNLGDEDLEYKLSDKFDWLTETPASGILKAGETAKVAIGANCGYNAGAYNGIVSIETNDKDNKIANLEVNLVCTSLPIEKFPLNVYVDGDGKITSEDGHIDCDKDGGKCGFEYEVGSEVSLTATAASEAEFDGWGRDASGQETTIEVVVDKTKHVSANFSSTNDSTKTLHVSVSGKGTVKSADGKIDCSKMDVDCSVEYEKDTVVTLQPTAAEGETFLSWSGDCSGTGNCVITMSKSSSVTASFSEAHPSEDYEITFELLGSAKDSSRRKVFEAAAKRWMRVISKNPGREKIELSPNKACGFGEGAITADVDGLLIVAAIVPIDGKGGILGQAGPRYLRDNGIPVLGCMQFDEADIESMESNGSFNGVILHEMGHVIGIGTMWKSMNLLNDFKPTTACSSSSQTFTTKPSFTGEQALTEYSALGGSGNIPVEDEGGRGTRCGHWDEATFKNELMTGWANAGEMPLSKMTAASLEDMGYTVNINAADDYQLPKADVVSSAALDGFALNERLIMPIYKLGKNGEIIDLRETK